MKYVLIAFSIIGFIASLLTVFLFIRYLESSGWKHLSRDLWHDMRKIFPRFLRGNRKELKQQRGATAIGPLIPGDKSQFVKDITYPDGSEVKVGSRFTKIWEIQNIGSIPWIDRYLERVGPFEGLGRLTSPRIVRIPYTLPGDKCQIAVRLRAPDYPGTSEAKWKMIDNQNRLCLPNQIPLYFSFDVVEERNVD